MTTAVDRTTVVALLLVLAALGVSFVCPPWYRPIHNPATTARSDMEEIGAALETYRHDVGRYPTTAEGLAALMRRPALAPPDGTWYGPYVTSAMPLDPWRYAYQYRATDGTFRVWSNGADGISGGKGAGADVVLRDGDSAK
ncbi:MAG: type II secretion system protein GspG [Gemmatimonadaceae bacterium]